MEHLALILLAFFTFIGFIAIFFTSIGTAIILFGAVLFAWMTDLQLLGINSLMVLIALYIFGELIEFICTYWGAKTFGASNRSAIGAMIGGVIGAIIGLTFAGVGAIPGTFLGIFLGAALVERALGKDWRQSLKAGTGGVLGRIGSIIVKVFIAFAMIILMINQIFFSV